MMMKNPVLFTIYFFTLLLVGCTNGRDATVFFRVSADNIDTRDTIFITGNVPALGNWNPHAFPLTKTEEVWTGSIRIPVGTVLEFKITRGSWDKEALTQEGKIPGNYRFQALTDTVIELRCNRWKDKEIPVSGKVTGEVRYHRNLSWEGLLPRDVIVWLPPSYSTDPTKRYPVLYLHDGQNIIDPATSFMGVDWQVDEVADSLIRHVLLKEIIIVGIYNTPDRREEYSDSPKGKRYMEFIVKKLKPMIDSTYRTLPGRENTAVMGSSMGGLISFLLAWYYPDVFSMAGCLSPAFIYNNGHSLKLVAEWNQSIPDIKIYMDNGTENLERQLQPGCDTMLTLLQQKGFRPGHNLLWFQDIGADHNEAAWAERVWRPLLFFFGKDKQIRQ